MPKKSAVVLLSGGLDSVVSLAHLKDELDIKIALTFDYGQRAVKEEIKAAQEIANFYNINHKVIDASWLAEITNTALVDTSENLPDLKNLDSFDEATKSAKAVWVPNRNGAFLNIAASFCDSIKADFIIFGGNKEEGTTFPDNTQEFIDAINKSFEYSTLAKPKVIAPLINYSKTQIVTIGAQKNIPFKFIRSCYTNQQKHCGACESCKRLKRALEEAELKNILEDIFDEEKIS